MQILPLCSLSGSFLLSLAFSFLVNLHSYLTQPLGVPDAPTVAKQHQDLLIGILGSPFFTRMEPQVTLSRLTPTMYFIDDSYFNLQITNARGNKLPTLLMR